MAAQVLMIFGQYEKYESKYCIGNLAMDPIISNKTVAIGFVGNGGLYPVGLGPGAEYPEFKYNKYLIQSSNPNSVFRLTRQLLFDLGLDRVNFGTPSWNPIGDLVKEGANILLKPNWVLHGAQNGIDSLVTHQSIIHAILPYVYLAKPKRIIIGDAPLQYCDLDALLKNYDFSFFLNNASGCPLEIKDFRRTISTISNKFWKVKEHCAPRDDYYEVGLGQHSLLEPISSDWEKFRVTVYDPRLMWKHHYKGCHNYLIAKDILNADLVINLPKLKTHEKAGVTCCLKNLIGINGNKEYLPHHRKGGSFKGGDAYYGSSMLLGLMEGVWDVANKNRNNALIFNVLFRLAFKIKALDERLGGSGRAEGSWYGNDTIWRTCLDLNRILLYCSANGRICNKPVRSVLNLVDAVIAGQGAGPLNPEPLNAHMLLGGVNSAAVDWVAAAMLGYDPQKIPTINNAFKPFDFPIVTYQPDEIELVHNSLAQKVNEFVKINMIPAKPASGWENYIEAN
jgi:uncharacterized protein (DUF362 family)